MWPVRFFDSGRIGITKLSRNSAEASKNGGKANVKLKTERQTAKEVKPCSIPKSHGSAALLQPVIMIMQ